ncbi:MAG: amidohydrolase family protein [Candidatus Brocadiaceae bacterium]|nr:amidohydrolase family protein [Candidatus Brocadiaceae bacterium]
MKLFDARIVLGRAIDLEPFQSSDVESIRRALDRYGIERALLSSFASFRFDVSYGNRLTFEAAAADPRLIPCPAVLPDAVGEVGDEDALVGGLIERGARCVGLYPKSCGLAADERVLGRLLSAACVRRLPVQVPAGELDLLPMAGLAARHPDVPFIYCPYPPGLYRDRNLLPVLADTPNLHMTINPPFGLNEGIETICARIGSGRLLFASNYPIAEPGAAIGHLAYADIPPGDLESIAFRNLEGLIHAVRL